MALTPDLQKFGHTISTPEACEAVTDVMESAALVMFGAWLQTKTHTMPGSAQENVGRIGDILNKFGVARQQINGGLSITDVSDELTEAARAWDTIAIWMDGQQVPPQVVENAAQTIVDALDYVHKRNSEHGTNHPRWTARLLTGRACKECGR